jgi:Tfp pilus assembly PilM family ATPase
MKNIYKNTFGLQISNEFLKAVELSNGKSGLFLRNYSLVPLSPGVVEDNCIVINKEAFKEAVQKLITEANNGQMASKNVIISIPEEKTFSHHLEIPVEYSKDDEYIKKMARDYIPIDLTEAIIDYRPIEEESNKNTVVFDFAAVQKMLVKPLINILGEMGLNVIGIDVSKNSILRCCNNRFQKNDGGYLVSYLDVDKFSICVSMPSGHAYSLSISPDELHIAEKMKRILNTKNADELFSVMNEYKQNEQSLQPEKQKNLQDELREELDIIMKRTKELIKAIKNQEGFNLKNVYLLGRYSSLPGLKEEYQTMFPEAEIKTKLNYIDINGVAEMIFSETIGLALRSALKEENEKNVNLLPVEKKNEIYIAKSTPAIKTYSILLNIALVCLVIFAGIGAVSNYLTYKITNQELAVYVEEANNPYLTQIARTNQQKTMLENQITTITQNIIPISDMLKKLDAFNLDGVSLVSLDYRLNKDNKPGIRLRAKVKDRETTEVFISELEKTDYFDEVDSPLSNLVGKGERFVNIDLLLNPLKIIEGYGKTGSKPIMPK